jgi:hypothetical protein
MSLDPKGYYARLAVSPDASAPDITAAFRRQARLLHPDVPDTGDTDSFIAIRQAYDILSDPDKRMAYDRAARQAQLDAIEPEDLGIPMAPVFVEPPMRRPRLSDMPIAVGLGLGLVVVVSAYQLVVRLTAAEPERASIRPNAPMVAPAGSPGVPATLPPRLPTRLAGVPNHYTIPSPGLATVWRVEPESNRLIVTGQLQPFTPVQALRLLRQPGLVEIRLSETTTGLVQAARLTAGNEDAARRAFCIYHAGPAPGSGEVLHQPARGPASLTVQNRSSGPAVVKLRDRAGVTAVSVYLGPGEERAVGGLPDAVYRADYAFGEVWSRGCNGFAVGVQAWRLPAYRPLAALTPLAIPPDRATSEQPVELPDQAFNKD